MEHHVDVDHILPPQKNINKAMGTQWKHMQPTVDNQPLNHTGAPIDPLTVNDPISNLN